MQVGGSIISVALDGRQFSVAADADGLVKLGGSENDIQANGNLTARLIKTQVPWSVSGLALGIDDDAGDAEFIQSLANRNVLFPVTFTLAGGTIWQGTGQVTGENPRSTQNATLTVDLMGEGELTQQ